MNTFPDDDERNTHFIAHFGEKISRYQLQTTQKKKDSDMKILFVILIAAFTTILVPQASANDDSSVKITSVTIYPEYTSAQNEFRWSFSSRVYVLTFDRAVRNRGGVLEATINGKVVGLPVRPTVALNEGRIPRYDESTTQLEMRAWDILELGNEIDSHNVEQVIGRGLYDPQFEIAAIEALVGHSIHLYLEACPSSFSGEASVVDTNYRDPRFNTMNRFLLLKSPQVSAAFSVRGLWAKIDVNHTPAYVWLHTGDNSNDDSLFASDIFETSSALLGSELTPSQIATMIDGRQLGFRFDEGALPRCSLDHPFP